MKKNQVFEKLSNFLKESVTAYHAVDQIKSKLAEQNYIELKEQDIWDLKPHQGYFVIRDSSSIIAFKLGDSPLVETGIRILGAHTDSPHLKIKPKFCVNENQSWKALVEVYGGVLLQSWFDRDLGVAGRISGLDSKGDQVSELIKTNHPIASIPRVAIHLNRGANTSGVDNTQIELSPILSYNRLDSKFDFSKFLKTQINKTKGKSPLKEILGHDLSFFDFQEPEVIGVEGECIASARLDNLLSCFVISEALISKNDRKSSQSTMMVCHDHEEVGSSSYVGASGSFVGDVLDRICVNQSENLQMKSQSIFLSIDNAHAFHPNYPEKYDGSHKVFMGEGPALKFNANQKYATNGETASWLKLVAQKSKVNLQEYVSRNDIGCGSTIGPLSATRLGIKTVDLGIPSLAMHSIRELAHLDDIYSLYKMLKSII